VWTRELLSKARLTLVATDADRTTVVADNGDRGVTSTEISTVIVFYTTPLDVTLSGLRVRVQAGHPADDAADTRTRTLGPMPTVSSRRRN